MLILRPHGQNLSNKNFKDSAALKHRFSGECDPENGVYRCEFASSHRGQNAGGLMPCFTAGHTLIGLRRSGPHADTTNDTKHFLLLPNPHVRSFPDGTSNTFQSRHRRPEGRTWVTDWNECFGWTRVRGPARLRLGLTTKLRVYQKVHVHHLPLRCKRTNTTNQKWSCTPTVNIWIIVPLSRVCTLVR